MGDTVAGIAPVMSLPETRPTLSEIAGLLPGTGTVFEASEERADEARSAVPIMAATGRRIDPRIKSPVFPRVSHSFAAGLPNERLPGFIDHSNRTAATLAPGGEPQGLCGLNVKLLRENRHEMPCHGACRSPLT